MSGTMNIGMKVKAVKTKKGVVLKTNDGSFVNANGTPQPKEDTAQVFQTGDESAIQEFANRHGLELVEQF